MRIVVQHARSGKLYVYDSDARRLSEAIRKGTRRNEFGEAPDDVAVTAVECSRPVDAWNWQEWTVLTRTA